MQCCTVAIVFKYPISCHACSGAHFRERKLTRTYPLKIDFGGFTYHAQCNSGLHFVFDLFILDKLLHISLS